VIAMMIIGETMLAIEADLVLLRSNRIRMCLRLGEFQMRRDKPSSEQSGPTTRYGRQIAYDREIFIAICRRFLLGEDLRTICAKPPMPRSCF
jgi:hypothetical protein